MGHQAGTCHLYESHSIKKVEYKILHFHRHSSFKPESKVQSPKVKTKRTLADTKITWATKQALATFMNPTLSIKYIAKVTSSEGSGN